MNTGDSFLTSSVPDIRTGDTSNTHTNRSDSLNIDGLGEARDVVTDDPNRTTGTSLSIVERRFSRMSEAHDRIRTELLARHPSVSR
jgi:hypothetical protein